VLKEHPASMIRTGESSPSSWRGSCALTANRWENVRACLEPWRTVRLRVEYSETLLKLISRTACVDDETHSQKKMLNIRRGVPERAYLVPDLNLPNHTLCGLPATIRFPLSAFVLVIEEMDYRVGLTQVPKSSRDQNECVSVAPCEGPSGYVLVVADQTKTFMFVAVGFFPCWSILNM